MMGVVLYLIGLRSPLGRIELCVCFGFLPGQECAVCGPEAKAVKHTLTRHLHTHFLPSVVWGYVICDCSISVPPAFLSILHCYGAQGQQIKPDYVYNLCLLYILTITLWL